MLCLFNHLAHCILPQYHPLAKENRNLKWFWWIESYERFMIDKGVWIFSVRVERNCYCLYEAYIKIDVVWVNLYVCILYDTTIHYTTHIILSQIYIINTKKKKAHEHQGGGGCSKNKNIFLLFSLFDSHRIYTQYQVITFCTFRFDS